MADTYYFISDLHIGGDEQLEHVSFLDELLEFLESLETTEEDAELLINGDAFGLWEFTEVEGPAKFDALVDRYPELFAQLEATGEQIPITIMPGNHDYELAAYSEYVERFAAYNVTVDQSVSLTRAVGDHVVHVEHGMQEDANNRIPDFGNPYANPLGYFVNRHVTSLAGRLSGRGTYNWLRDIQAVTPMTQIPAWLISNYYYREMSPWLRYAALPFLAFFNLGVLFLAMVLLDVSGVWSVPLTTFESLLSLFGPVGGTVELFLVANTVLLVVLTLVAIPLYVFGRDVRKTLHRFGLYRRNSDLDEDPYLDRAREVFSHDPSVAVYVYGHTHRVSITQLRDRLVVNTGTWLKRLHRTEPVVGLLPPVFYASYRLSYFRITAEDGAVLVDFEELEKGDPDDETLLERLVTRSPDQHDPLPARTVVDPGHEKSGSVDRDG